MNVNIIQGAAKALDSATPHSNGCRGVVSTDNRGGFASVRCRNWEPALDLGAYAGLRLRLKGNGLRCALGITAGVP